MKQPQNNQRYAEKQPPEWEAFLKDVTYKPTQTEVPFDPNIMNQMLSSFTFNELMEMRLDAENDLETENQLETLHKIARRKLKDGVRECFLLLLHTGETYRRIAEILNLSEDTVQRHIKKGIQQIKHFLQAQKTGAFPTPQGTRPVLRASVFPLDTDDEQKQFVKFLNRETVVHVSYRGDELFREALVVYMKGKSIRKLNEAGKKARST